MPPRRNVLAFALANKISTNSERSSFTCSSPPLRKQTCYFNSDINTNIITWKHYATSVKPFFVIPVTPYSISPRSSLFLPLDPLFQSHSHSLTHNVIPSISGCFHPACDSETSNGRGNFHEKSVKELPSLAAGLAEAVRAPRAGDIVRVGYKISDIAETGARMWSLRRRCTLRSNPSTFFEESHRTY